MRDFDPFENPAGGRRLRPPVLGPMFVGWVIGLLTAVAFVGHL